MIEGDLNLIEWDIDQMSEVRLIQYNLDWLREIYLIEGDLDWKIEIKDTFYEIWDPDWVRSKNNWVGSDLLSDIIDWLSKNIDWLSEIIDW